MIHDFNDFHKEHNTNSKPPLAGEGMQNNLISTQSTTHHERPLDRILNAIISQGGKVTGTGAQRMCTCPAHEDRTPSLSVKEAPDGAVLLHCHAGCSTESILQSLGLFMRDLYPHDTTATVNTSINGHQNRQSASDSAGRAISEDGFDDLDSAMRVYAKSLGMHDHRWEYHNASGELVGVILRWETPKGKEVRPISLIDGCWQLKGMLNPCPLYRLPSILNSEGPVIVCEGEKAADAAIACGFVATTSPHGSKSASKADWSVLQGRDVVIVPDLDDAGDAYAVDVMGLCAGTKSIRVVDLSEVWGDQELGADLADVLDLEAGDIDEVCTKLEALIEQTQPESLHKNSERTARIFQKFPVELLPEPVRSYVEQGALAIGCDPSFIALPVLSMLAGAIGNTHRVKLKYTFEQPSIVWSCIIGKSGSAKSPALEYATRPLRRIQQQQMAQHKQEMIDAQVSPQDECRASRCLMDDATIEAALEVMSNNPRGMMLCRDELAGWFDFGKYSSSSSGLNSAQWLELFDGKSIHIDRRTQKPIYIPRAGLSITGGIQPGILRRVLSSTLLENGLAARMLFTMPPPIPRKWTDRDVHPEVDRQMQTLVAHLIEHTMNTAAPDASEEMPEPHLIEFSSEAMALFERFFNEFHRSVEQEAEHISSALVKLVGYAARIALILHLVREAAADQSLSDPECIDEQSMRAAIGIVKWFRTETIRVYSMLAMDEGEIENQGAVDWINKQGGVVTIRKFSRGLSKYNSTKSAEQKLKELEQSGIGYFRGKKPHGRTQEFVLHPKYRSHPDTTVIDSSGVSRTLNGGTGSGASAGYPVQLTKEGT
ncbi:MAG: DUF3987 domain-containing protein [Phycisphaerales bacterium]|nr:DUF3987 domain-containing protein [Phycisphaerales bacterium]